MINKALLATGTLVSAFALTIGLVMAQTAAPSPTASPTASPSAIVPTGAPATGMGAY